MVRPLTSFTGTTDFLKRPSSQALAGALLALDRVGVDVVAREAVLGGDQVGGDALRHEIGRRARSTDRPARRRRRRRCRRGSSIRRRRRCVMSCWPDITCGRGEVHRVEAGGAEAVDLHARHARRRSRPRAPRRARCRRRPRRPDRRSPAPRRRPASVSSLLRSLQRGERLRRQIERGHLVQRAVGLAAAARGADGVVDECVGIGRASVSFCQRAASQELSRDQQLHDLVGPRIDAHARARRGRGARSDIRPYSHSRRTIAGSGRSPCLQCR